MVSEGPLQPLPFCDSVLGSSPTEDKCLPAPEEQDQRGFSVHSLGRLEL